MFKKYVFLLFIATSFSLFATEHIELPAIDAQQLKQDNSGFDGPLKYAVPTSLDKINHAKQTHSQANWQKNAKGQMEYTLRYSAKNATSLNIGMTDFFLPPSAELWVYNDDKSILRGPYTDRFNPKNGYFWIGDVPGDNLTLSFTVNPIEQKYLSFSIEHVARGFYEYWKSSDENGLKSGSCNIDVACSEGDNWRPEISSVGQYSFQTSDGGYVCTGQLINNTTQDGTPYFLTASHCGYTGSSDSEKDSVAASINIIWNYESLTCRTPGSGSSGSPINSGTFNQRQAGTTFVANNASSDFALLLLNQTPHSSYDIQYTGWDRTDTAFDAGIGIHHPSGHAKRISFEDDPLLITGYLQSNGGGTTHLRVVDWDKGTTEGGSSGSGLWNSDYRLVGQLHGGYAGCGNDESDWYGRFYYSWNEGNDATSRLSDWLDPIDTRQTTLDTTGRCDAPVVSINTPNSIEVGEDAIFTANVTGGSGNYQYFWDLNGDGHIDGQSNSIETRYAQGYTGNVTLTVKDDSGCQAVDSRAVIVESPDIQIDGDPEFTQVCGNNDNIIDPGERWRATVNVTNVGNQTANNGFLMFDNKNEPESDNFGNITAQCQADFIDISNSGTPYNWTLGPVTGTTADDEGYAEIQLSQSFQFYDQTVSSLVASTNGYLNTNANANGIDWDNDCPLPATPDKDSIGGRIAVMHDDLNSSQLYHQSFNDCPRNAETGENLACDIFLWKGAYFYGSAAIDSMDIQAILYPDTSQWVFQHLGPGADGESATVGIQNTAANDGLTFACNTANSLSEEQAVCVFHKDYPQSANDSFVTLETPAVALNNLDINDSQTIHLDFSVDSNAVCGTELSINHSASVFDQGFNPGQSEVIKFQVGNNGECQVSNQCNINNNNTAIPKTGLWWNPDRTGHGFDMHVIGNDRLLYTSYSGDSDGSPVWYVADKDESAHNLFYNDIGKVTFPGGFDTGQRENEIVGWSNTYFLDAEHAIQYRKINDHVMAEKLEYQHLDTQTTINQHTGHYYTPSESGWGQTVVTEGRYRVIVSYLYDQEGNPYWTYGSGLNDDSALTAGHFDTFCNHCPWVEPNAQAVGEINMEFNGQTDGLINFYDIEYSGDTPQSDVDWQRTQLPVVNRNPQP
ncbi:MAG: PKD domain-containing protein [Proteobacteria bacterium]|nr:PKD domain-containing protein [Pseudomonadota bacterium]